MSYTEALTSLSSRHRVEIETDLDVAREELRRSLDGCKAAQRRVNLLEALLGAGESVPPGSPSVTRGDGDTEGPMTLHVAMHKVLKEKGRLRAGDIIAEIERRGLYRMRDGRLPESQQIHARVGHYPELIGKDGSYFYAK